VNETQLVIRVARSYDGEPVRKFLTGLSPATQYLRFFAELPRVPPGMITRLITVTPRQLVLLAVDGDAVVGHAMAVCAGDRTVDVGIVVADAYRGARLGDRLLRHLIDTVTRYGVDEIHTDVLSQNRLVLEWLRRRLPDVRFEHSGTTVAAHGHLGVPAA